MSEKPHGKNRIRDQVRRNAVALISLFVAISGLTYNTWRNEVTEENRNQRWASFEVLLKLGEFQQVVFHLHFDHRTVEPSTRRQGWALVMTIRDLTAILEEPISESGAALLTVWEANNGGLGNADREAVNAINTAIDAVRQDTLDTLSMLD